MDSNKLYLYRNAIQSIYPDATDFREPSLRGNQDNILIAQTDSGDRVFKFNNEDIVRKNAKVSYLYNVRGIPVPQITPRDYKNLHFEDYAEIKGTPLRVAITQGMDAKQVKAIYREVMDEFIKMERVYPELIGNESVNYAPEIARKHITTTRGVLPGLAAYALTMSLNINSKNNSVYHFDLSPANIIVSDDGHLQGIIDLDSIGICSQDFAFAMLGARYQQIGLDIKDLFRYYNTKNNNSLNYDRISAIANIRQKMLSSKHPKCR